MVATPRIVLVTGSARRVGRAVAEAFVRAHWDVLVYARDAGRAAATARDIGAVAGIGADLRSYDGVVQLAHEVARRADVAMRGLAAIVHCASTFDRAGEWTTAAATADRWDSLLDTFAVNAIAPYALTSLLAPELERASGVVVAVSDHAPHDDWPAYPVHAASKAALESFAHTGARALDPRGILVVAVAPGTILPPTERPDVVVSDADRAVAPARLAAFLDTVVALAARAPDAPTGPVVVLRDPPGMGTGNA